MLSGIDLDITITPKSVQTDISKPTASTAAFRVLLRYLSSHGKSTKKVKNWITCDHLKLEVGQKRQNKAEP